MDAELINRLEPKRQAACAELRNEPTHTGSFWEMEDGREVLAVYFDPLPTGSLLHRVENLLAGLPYVIRHRPGARAMGI